MALDRRIVIHIEAPGHRASAEEAAMDPDLAPGDYIPGPITDYPVWAERRAAGSQDTPTVGGQVVTSVVTYTVRWFLELELANIVYVNVTDENNTYWDGDTVSPGDARRRLITITCLRST